MCIYKVAVVDNSIEPVPVVDNKGMAFVITESPVVENLT